MGQTQSSHPSKRKRSDTQASEHGHQHITPFVYKEQKSVHSSGKPTIPQFDERRCEEWYMRYADPDTPDYILPEGTQQFFEDMNVSMEDIAVVAIAWKMNMATMGYITKNEWMSSMRKFGTDSMEKLKRKRAELEKSVHDPEQLKEMYNYTFGYAKNKEQKCMDVDVAIVLWNLILADKYPVVFEFVRFLQEKQPVRVINRDQWRSFYEFVTTVSSNLSDYDETSAWPVLFDEFVEWKQEN